VHFNRRKNFIKNCTHQKLAKPAELPRINNNSIIEGNNKSDVAFLSKLNPLNWNQLKFN
jgi:hypothetical protein